MVPKALFIKSGSFSNINNSVFKILEGEFSEFKIETIDTWEIIKNKVSTFHFFLNIYFFINEYGNDLISGNKKWKDWVQWFFATSYISLLISRKIKKFCKGKEYKFTFQTQSIFNGKVENIPNFVYTDHTTKTNLLYPDINPRQYIRSKRFIEKSEIKTYTDASMIFTFGSLVTNSLINQYKIPKEKLLTIYSGSNTPHNINVKPEKYFSKNILFVGTDWERKGGPLLLKVFEKVLQVHSDASLTIVGCNPKNILLPNCKVVGKVPIENVANYYELASLFCLPTIREPFGIVFVEAMSFRLPIITNNIGSMKDLIINNFNGYLIDNNLKDYNMAICSLLENPKKCREMGENGYKYARFKFNWEIVGKKMKSRISEFL